MNDEIHDFDPSTGLSRGVLAIDPSGHLVTLGRTQSLKAGFRLATRADVYGEPAIAPIEPTPLPPADPEPFFDSPIEPSDPDQD